jgi:CDP-glucose 4,6-dehydratase
MPTDFEIYSGKRVLVTGHTGFKGAWLCQWLLELGAEVHGLALAPLEPSLFESLELAGRRRHRRMFSRWCGWTTFESMELAGRMKHNVQDIRDASRVEKLVREIRPEMIFHLAAQPLVRVSYAEPVRTFAVNVLGTVHVLEAVRAAQLACSIVVVTTDKCYENDGRARSFAESDPLGGHDPYSASKAAAELVTAAYRDSFFSHGTDVALASARAGNVVGGGDWAEDRIVPDCIRALEAGAPVPVRNPEFTRPWQHVLEPLGGYLLLGARLEEARGRKSAEEIVRYAQAFNFGPQPDANRSVRELVEEVLRHWPGSWKQIPQEKHLKEAPLLSLAIEKARERLGWRPRWDFSETVARTVSWYREYAARKGKGSAPAMIDFTREQIGAYEKGY